MKNETKFLAVSLLILITVFSASLSIIKYNEKSVNLTASSIESITNNNALILEINKQITEIVSRNDSLSKTNITLSGLLQKRKVLLLEYLEKNPTEVYNLSLDSNILGKLQSFEYQNIEKSITGLTGNIGITIIDDFDRPENSTYEYDLTTRDGKKYRFYPFNEENIEPNTKIEIKDGIQLGTSIFGELSRLSVNIEAMPNIISYNSTTKIIWQVEGATYCSGSGGSNGWSGPKNITNGTFLTGKLLIDTTYTITCQNNFDTLTRSVKVTVIKDISTEDYINNVLTSYTPPVTEPVPYKVGVFLINPNPNWPIPFSVEQVKKKFLMGNSKDLSRKLRMIKDI